MRGSVASLYAPATPGAREEGPQYNLVSWALNSFGVPLDDFLPAPGLRLALERKRD